MVNGCIGVHCYDTNKSERCVSQKSPWRKPVNAKDICYLEFKGCLRNDQQSARNLVKIYLSRNFTVVLREKRKSFFKVISGTSILCETSKFE